MEIRTFDEIYNGMKNYIISHQDKLTDFNYGAVLSSQIEAWARELAELYIRTMVGFSTFLRALPSSVFGFEMKNGTKASAIVRFKRGRPFSYDTPILENCIVAAGSLIFTTVSPGMVLSGEVVSNEVSVIAEEVGEKYNVGSGAINRLVTTLSADIVGVSNDQPATGGVSMESWQDFVARFADYIVGLQRTNNAGFRSGLIKGHEVRSYEKVEHFPPLDGIWNMTVYLEDGSGDMPETGFEQAKAIIDGDGTATNGGFRAPGINVRYLPPEKIPVIPKIKVVTTEDVTNEIDESEVRDEVDRRTKEYINGLKIGEKFVRSDLTVVLKRIIYLDDIEILLPIANIEIAKNQIARYAGCEVIVEVA
jgi:uncharacterized phage protein gp47/JayE